jgi:isochorismate pyruvate lyase
MAVNCDSLGQVREKIDGLDRQIVGLIAERGAYVSQAARFKKDSDAVRAPQRVEQVIGKVRAWPMNWAPTRTSLRACTAP